MTESYLFFKRTKNKNIDNSNPDWINAKTKATQAIYISMLILSVRADT